MTKTELKTYFYDLIKVLEDDGVTVQGSESDVESYTPLVTYQILDKNNRLVQDRIERWSTIYFMVNVYGSSSVECTTISDNIDSILKPVGFEETSVLDGYDKNSKKHKIASVYQITIDENGYSYSMK